MKQFLQILEGNSHKPYCLWKIILGIFLTLRWLRVLG